MDYAMTNISRIADYIRSGEKMPGTEKIGAEIEHFIIDIKTGRTISYDEKGGARDLLHALIPRYDRKIYIDGHFMGLAREDGSVSLEPAAQFEISLAPQGKISDLENAYRRFYSETTAALAKDGLTLLHLGYHPVSKISELTRIPKIRYEYMSEYLKTTGKYAWNMMKGTCSVQAAIDYTSESDFSNKLRIANCLSPFLYFFTDNTPVFEGNAAPEMMRSRIWDEVDPARCGIIPGSIDKQFSYIDYALYIYSRPAIYTLIDGKTYNTAAKTLDNIFRNREMSHDEIEHALGMFFPDARVKSYIEIRMADCMPQEYIFAYAALIKGLFYHGDTLNKLLSLFEHSTDATISAIKRELYESGKNAVIFGKNIYDFGIELCDMAYVALGDEKDYLLPFAEMMKKRQNVYETTSFTPFAYCDTASKSV